MNDELQDALSAWATPPLSASARERVEALLRDSSLAGPVVRSRGAGAAFLPLTYAVFVGALVVAMLTTQNPRRPALTQHHITVSAPPVVAPGLPADAQVTAAAVSIVSLEGYEPIGNPRIRVVRRER